MAIIIFFLFLHITRAILGKINVGNINTQVINISILQRMAPLFEDWCPTPRTYKCLLFMASKHTPGNYGAIISYSIRSF